MIDRVPVRSIQYDDSPRDQRGSRRAMSAKTFELLGKAPYAGMFTRLDQDGVAVRDIAAMCAPADGKSCC